LDFDWANRGDGRIGDARLYSLSSVGEDGRLSFVLPVARVGVIDCSNSGGTSGGVCGLEQEESPELSWVVKIVRLSLALLMIG
jgi:hypothetical protein